MPQQSRRTSPPPRKGKTTALATVKDELLAPIADFSDYGKRLAQLKASGQVNLLTPLARVDYMLPMHQVSMRVVQLDPAVDRSGNGPECYRDRRFCDEDERAFGKIAIVKLMNAANVQELEIRRLDDESEPYRCVIETTLGMRTFDGQWIQRKARKEIDLRDGAPDTMKPEWVCQQHERADCPNCRERSSYRKTGRQVPLADSALAEKRKHMVSTCETLSGERCLRKMLELQQKYKVDQVLKPWVIPVLVADLDESDPEVKRRLLDVALSAERAVFGPRAGQLKEEPRQLGEARVDDDQVSGSPVIEHQPEPEAPSRQPDPEDMEEAFAEPPDEEAVEEPEGEEIHVCGCDCGHQVEVSATVAEMTEERVGGPRCQLCYPGKYFDLESHKHLEVLGLPKYPELTPAQAAEWGQRKKADR